ncbi:cytochrome P450 [Kockovaella imperatae]|uniref:Cytochrome P450 n=1 Tax=Kockovaella imperatae TaxID=4999 RepID=A0A1Y1UKN2_9TREE|nr:cytochrome P450 [Kockovaella imperatae]ORX37695.1 cytochrome P450 [Kockovaella imperatae]
MFIPKVVLEDSLIPYTTWDEDGNVSRHERFIRAGSHVVIDSPACSVNPFYWEDPLEFRPRRHVDERGLHIKEGFTGFSIGQRSCIGKRFAEVESVALLSHLVKTYALKPAPVRPGETLDEMRERMVWTASEELNLTPGNFSLGFTKRT